MPRIKIEVDGIGSVRKELGVAKAATLRRRIGTDIEQGTDEMAEQAHDNAPVDTGALKNSILASVQKEAPLTWVFGSHLPYAQWQEYNHATHGFYFRRAIHAEMRPLQEKLEHTVRRTLS